MSLIFLTSNIGTSVGEEGPRKFQKLTSLMNCVLILSHGNVDPERGFSVNKHLNIHRSTTSEETIEAFRYVKDCLNRKGGVESIKVSKGACRKEKAGIRSKRSSHKSSGARKETGQT